MKVKRILRFYFAADKLERALNNLILRHAYSSQNASGDFCSVKIVEVIDQKIKLSRLWDYLHNIISKFSQKDKNVLCFYALMRQGLSACSEKTLKEVKRVTVKFSRKAKQGLLAFKKELELLGTYYVLL